MSGAGVQTGLAVTSPGATELISQLLHALNQPLTGLQCSLELAVAGPRQSAEYVRTLRDALQLCARMRILVEGLRELTGPARERGSASEFFLEDLLSDVIDDLRPVAGARGVELAYASSGRLPVHADRLHIGNGVFRLLDSVISLARANSKLQIIARADEANASIEFCWIRGQSPEFSPWSAPELGFLVALAEWERAGGQSKLDLAGEKPMCALEMQLESSGAGKGRG